MATPGEIRVGDVGTKLVLTVVDEGIIVDLSEATVLTIKMQPKDGKLSVQTGILVGDGTDGKMMYITQEGDLKVDGKWLIQGHVETPAGKWHTDIKEFYVHQNL